MIPHSRPWITGADTAAVESVLQGEMLAQGDTSARFEDAFSRWLGLPAPGVGVASGVSALHLALLALNIHGGDEVVLPTYVCRSVLDAVRATGATPVLADASDHFVLTPSRIEPRLTARTRAIVVPHLYGIFADVPAFRGFGLPLVEDCAQAVDRPGRWSMAGDIGVFSFHPTKCLTTGEGGLAVSRDPALNRRLRLLRDGGAGARRVFAPLSDLAAALGMSQLARLDEALDRRRQIAAVYRQALGEGGDRLLRRTPRDRTMHFRFVLSHPDGFDEAACAFAREGVIVRRGVDELLHRVLGLPDREFPAAVELFETTVSIPIYPALDATEVAICAGALAACCLEAAWA